MEYSFSVDLIGLKLTFKLKSNIQLQHEFCIFQTVFSYFYLVWIFIFYALNVGKIKKKQI